MNNTQITMFNSNISDSVSSIGNIIDVNQIVSASFVPVFGDVTAAGTIKLQVSNDIPTTYRQLFVPTNWADIPNATSTISSGVGPAIVIGNMAFSYIRAVYTKTSGGSTTIQVYANVLSC